MDFAKVYFMPVPFQMSEKMTRDSIQQRNIYQKYNNEDKLDITVTCILELRKISL